MDSLYDRYPALREEQDQIEQVIKVLIETFEAGGKLLLCGNGGSAADCDHIVGELMKGFLKKRPLSRELRHRFAQIGEEAMCDCLQEGLPAVSLTHGGALPSAYANDVDPDYIYAQQVLGLGKEGDVLIGISTSGNAQNVRNAMLTARAIGMKTVGLTGKSGGWLGEHADLAIKVPETETWKIQELHLPVYHWICMCVEKYFFEC